MSLTIHLYDQITAFISWSTTWVCLQQNMTCKLILRVTWAHDFLENFPRNSRTFAFVRSFTNYLTSTIAFQVRIPAYHTLYNSNVQDMLLRRNPYYQRQNAEFLLWECQFSSVDFSEVSVFSILFSDGITNEKIKTWDEFYSALEPNTKK